MRLITRNTKKQVFIFLISTYIFSWILFLLGTTLEITPILFLGVWGPTIMAVLWTAVHYGKKGLTDLFKRFARYRVAWYWWVALLLLPAVIHFTGRSVWQLLYNGEINPFYTPPQYWINAILPSFLIAGFGEELGWRGFVLPRLQKHYTPIAASVLLAIVHLLWHAPTYWLGQGIHNVPLLYALGFVFPWTIIFNWLYNRSGGSLIFAVGFHAISNASLSIVRFMPLESEIPITPDLITTLSIPIELGGPYLSVVAVYSIVALLVIKYGKFNVVNTDIP